MKIAIPDMSCGGCLRSVTKALRSGDLDVAVDADLAARIVNVSTVRSEAEVLAALEAAGFPGTLLAG